MPVDPAAKIAELKQRKAQLEARIRTAERQASTTQRKADTRLKVLVGAAMLADAKLHPPVDEAVRTILARAITAEKDRAFLILQGWITP